MSTLSPLQSSESPPATPPPSPKDRSSFPPTSRIGRIRPLAKSDDKSKISAQQIHELIKTRGAKKSESPARSEKKPEITVHEEDSPLPIITLSNSSPELKRNGKLVNKISMKIQPQDAKSQATEEELEEEGNDGVSQEFIDSFNAMFGNATMTRKAQRLSVRMRQLAGLDEPGTGPVSVSEARSGFSMLSQSRNESIKINALTSLKELLGRDQRTEETSENLVPFATHFFSLIVRKEFMEERPPIQKLMEEIYDKLLPILQEQFEKGNIGKMTPELSSELTIAGIILGKVNTETVFEHKQYAINVPQARLGLCDRLAAQDDDSKIAALNSLNFILRNDPCTLDTAQELMNFSINYLRFINRQEFQKESLPVQEKMVEVYHSLMLLFNCQHTNKNIGPINEELKSEFMASATYLKKVAGQAGIGFMYNARCAREGSKRLIDDRQEVFEYLGRGFHLIAAVASLGVQEVDAGVNRMVSQFKKIRAPIGKRAWYDNVIFLKKIARDAFREMRYLTATQKFIGSKLPDPEDKKKEVEHKWEFYYAAVKMLSETCLKSQEMEISLSALTGNGKDTPGLVALAGLESLKNRVEANPKSGRKMLQKVDTNTYIRSFALDCLLEIAKNAKHEEVAIEAKNVLHERATVEKNSDLRMKLRENGYNRIKRYDSI